MSSPTIETRERVVRLEEQVKNLEKKIDDQGRKIDEMYTLLTQAKGMRFILMALIGLGGFVAAKITPLLSYLIPPK